MPDPSAKEESGAIGIDPPNHRSDMKRRAFRGDDLESHRRSDFQPRLGPDLCAKLADVHATRKVAECSGVNDDGPGDASSGILSPIFWLWGGHGHAMEQLVYQRPEGNAFGQLDINEPWECSV